jgi:hypothetical protein
MEFNNKVFINCPYDKKYKHFFVLIVFYCFYFGYEPVFASQIGGAESRIDKIIKMIKECDFGIHDISKAFIQDDESLPRYNMTFELGLDFMLKHNKKTRNKLLILDGEQYQYLKTISDLSGCDIIGHNNDEIRLINAIRDFFMGFNQYDKVPKGINLYEVFIKTFNLWMQVRNKDIGVEDFEELEMSEIKQNVKTFFDIFQSNKAQIKTNSVTQ